MEPIYPHCNSLILHQPFVCVYCDLYPDYQKARLEHGINFTGRSEEGFLRCPSEIGKPSGYKFPWGGNTAKTEAYQTYLNEYTQSYKPGD